MLQGSVRPTAPGPPAWGPVVEQEEEQEGGALRGTRDGVGGTL